MKVLGEVLQAAVGKDALSAVIVLIFFPLFFFFSMECLCVCVYLCVCLRVPSIGQIQGAAPKVLCHQHERGRW